MGRKASGGGGGCSCRIRSTIVREFLAEFLGLTKYIENRITFYIRLAGTFVLVAFGTASIAQSVLSLKTKGNFFTINWG